MEFLSDLRPASFADIISFMSLGMVFTVFFTQWKTVKKNNVYTTYFYIFLTFTINKFVFWQSGESYYFFQLVLDALQICFVSALYILKFKNKEKKKPELIALYGVFVPLVGGLTLLYLKHPENINGLGALVIAATFLVNIIVLVRNIDDAAVPILRCLVLWSLYYGYMYLKPLLLNQILQSLFFLTFAYTVARAVKKVNEHLQHNNALLIRARDVVVSMLYDISSSEKYLSSLDNTLRRILDAIIDALTVDGAAVYTISDTVPDSIRIKHSQSCGVFWTMHPGAAEQFAKPSYLLEHLKKKTFKMGEGIIGIVAESLEPLGLDRVNNRDKMKELGLNPTNIRNVLAVPLRVKDKALGVLVVQNQKNIMHSSEDNLHLLQALAEQAAISINNVQIYEELDKTNRLRQEMNIATDIQKQLLPRDVPTASNLKTATYIKPAKEVGGDYYDFIENKQGYHSVVIGDVSGKGLPAGMIMVIARTTLQIVAQNRTDVKDVVIRFTRLMYPRMRIGTFMTLNFLCWHDETRTMTYAAAGHEHILWYHKDEDYVEKIKAGGIAVGLIEDPTPLVKPNELKTKPGDVLVLYTDGITEARNVHDSMFTLKRVIESLQNHAALSDADSICAAILNDIHRFTGDTEQYDDMTLLVMSVS